MKNKLNQKGLVHILVLLLLLVGIVISVYLVQQKTNLFPKAGDLKPTGPETSFSLVGPSDCNSLLCLFNLQKGSTVEEEFKVQVFVRSDIDEANLFRAKMTFPKDLVEVTRIASDSGSFVKNWVEQTYDNNEGTISLVGGVPDPGFKTEQGKDSALMATIIFKTKETSKGTVSFTDDSLIYRNTDNLNILTVKRNLDISISTKPSQAHDIRFANQFSGADACAQIASALADLPSTGGTVDAKGLKGAQTCASNPFAGVTKPFKVIFGDATYTVSVSLTTSAPTSGTNIIEGVGEGTVFSFSNTTAAFVLASNTTLRNFKIDASGLTTAVTGDIFTQATSNIRIEGVTFLGGGHHINLNGVNNFWIGETRHISVTAPSNPIHIWQSNYGTISNVRIEGFTYPASSSSFRGIYVQNSNYINVIAPVIHDIDATTIPTFAGVSFANTTNSNLVGGTISNLKNGDGVVTEDGAKDINISGTVSTGNSNSEGTGTNANTGDAFDIFNSYRVNLSNCNARNNGHSSRERHINIEIFTSSDVTVDNCDASDGGFLGIGIIGSPNTKLVAVRANRNYQAGVSSSPATGTVDTNGTKVTWVSGRNFGAAWPANTDIIINSVAYKISSMTSTGLTLTTSAGSQTGVSYTVESSVQIIGGQYNDNGQGRGSTGTVEGIYLAGGTTGRIQGVLATDTRTVGSKTQTYGARIENTARADFIDNDFAGNLIGTIKDSVGNSQILPIPTTTPPPIKKGDGNTDGKINLVDISVLLTDFNKEQGFREPIDMNDDKKINTFDFSMLRKILIENGVIKR